MNYKEGLLKKLTNAEKWPTFRRPNFLNNLNELADNVYYKGTVEGFLAALLIYHQLCEEMLKVLIECSDFLIQCSVYPKEIKTTKIKGKMFGQLLSLFEQGILDDDKRVLIDKCKKLNQLRIRMVHKITLKSSLTDIERQIKPVKDIFDEIYSLFDMIYDNYRATFHDLSKDILESIES